MLILRNLFKFVELLHSENSTNQLSSGFVMGMFMGFTPILTLHWVAYVILLLILRINIGAAMLAFAGFGILAFGLDPVFHKLGLSLLTDVPSLTPLWTWLYHAPVVPYTRFNNSIVLGSFIVSLLAAVPVFFLARTLVVRYRKTVVERIKNTHLAKTLMATKVYRLYAKYREFKS